MRNKQRRGESCSLPWYVTEFKFREKLWIYIDITYTLRGCPSLCVIHMIHIWFICIHIFSISIAPWGITYIYLIAQGTIEIKLALYSASIHRRLHYILFHHMISKWDTTLVTNIKNISWVSEEKEQSIHGALHLDLSRCLLLHQSLQPPPWWQLL